jgi:hypothetical protein
VDEKEIRFWPMHQRSRPTTGIIAGNDRLNESSRLGCGPRSKIIWCGKARSAAFTSSESLLRLVLLQAALINPGPTRALRRAVRERFTRREKWSETNSRSRPAVCFKQALVVRIYTLGTGGSGRLWAVHRHFGRTQICDFDH